MESEMKCNYVISFNKIMQQIIRQIIRHFAI